MNFFEKKVLDWLQRLQRQKLSRVIGVVQSDTSVILVSGVPYQDLPRLGTYTPAEGDIVLIIRSGADLVVVGDIHGPGGS